MRIVAISGSRSDRAALDPVAEALGAESIHLTVHSSDNSYSAAIGCGKALIEANEHLNYHEADLVIIPGDRFEILGAACAAHLLGIPIAHIGGGDTTEGSLDNSMRHAISKLAHIHLTSCQKSAENLVMMGEETWRIVITGDPAIDGLAEMELYSKEETVRKLGITNPYFLVAYQPAWLDPLGEADTLVTALTRLRYPCVFTPLNNDAFGRHIESKFTRFCSDSMGVVLEMDRKLYLSAMKHCLTMIGNSSSGFYEAPSLKKAFVNIGDRQKGRIQAGSIITVVPHVDSIVVAVASSQQLDCTKVINPYGDGHAVERIKRVLSQLPDRDVLLTKKTGDLSQWFSNNSGNMFIASETGAGIRKKNLYDGWQDTLDPNRSAMN